MRRRTLLTAGGVLVGTTVAGAVSQPSKNHELVSTARASSDAGEAVTTTEQILSDTVYETTLYEIDAPQNGPTAMVFGGIHGDERSGIDAASDVTDWQPDAGTLVVIPETNAVAIENDEREGPDGDLNRQFPSEGEPTSDLARGIWAVVERYDPDVVLDLHRSIGIYDFHAPYVGQAVFYLEGAEGEALADALNESIPWYLPFHRITASESYISGPLLFQMAARELGSAAYLFETTDFMLDQEMKVELSRLATAHVLELHGLLETGGDA